VDVECFNGIVYHTCLNQIIHPPGSPSIIHALSFIWKLFPPRLPPSNTHLSCIVLGWLGRWTIRSGVTSRHTTINNKVSTVYEAALVAGKEEDALSLLDGFTKATGWEMDFAAVALSFVVAKPILQQRRAIVVSIL